MRDLMYLLVIKQQWEILSTEDYVKWRIGINYAYVLRGHLPDLLYSHLKQKQLLSPYCGFGNVLLHFECSFSYCDKYIVLDKIDSSYFTLGQYN
jgi:hypothetical protein